MAQLYLNQYEDFSSPQEGFPDYEPERHQLIISPGHPHFRKFMTCVPRFETGIRVGDDAGRSGPAELFFENKRDTLSAPHTSLNLVMRRYIVLQLPGTFDIKYLSRLKANLIVSGADYARGETMENPWLYYFLENAVCFSEAGLKGPQRLYKHVVEGMRGRLNAKWTAPSALARNPLSRGNRAIVGRVDFWTLGELRSHFELPQAWDNERQEQEPIATAATEVNDNSQPIFHASKIWASQKIKNTGRSDVTNSRLSWWRI